MQPAQPLQATAAEPSGLSGGAEGHITYSELEAGAGVTQPAPDAQHASPCGDRRQLASAGAAVACNCGSATQPTAVVQLRAAAAPVLVLPTAAVDAEGAAALSWLAAAGQPDDLAAGSVSETELLAVCGTAIEELLLGELLPCGNAQEAC